MIVVDTNVLSEVVARAPEPSVLAWCAAHAEELAISAVTVAELHHGIGRLARGRRRQALATAVERMLAAAAANDRLLAYDAAAARAHAELRVRREKAGRPTSVEDGMIAGTALSRDAAVATRNVSHFAGFGVEVLNPWAWSG